MDTDFILKMLIDDETPYPMVWETEYGDQVIGVLFIKNDILYMSVNSELSPIKKECKRIQKVFGFNDFQQKRIVQFYENLPLGITIKPLPVKLYTHSVPHNYGEYAKELSKTIRAYYWFNTFLTGNIDDLEKNPDKLITRKIPTESGIIHFSLSRTGKISNMFKASSHENICFVIETTKKFSNEEIILNIPKIQHFLEFLNCNELVLQSLQNDTEYILLPSMVKTRNPIKTVSQDNKKFNINWVDFLTFSNLTLANYFNVYDEIALILNELTSYYREINKVSDKIQLLRLFTAFELCANGCSNKINAANKEKEKEYKSFITQIKSITISKNLKNFIKNAKQYYINDDPKLKRNITNFLNYISDIFKVNDIVKNCELIKDNIDIIMNLRNALVHGKARQSDFYSLLNEFNQKIDTEKQLLRKAIDVVVRVYILSLLLPNDSEFVTKFGCIYKNEDIKIMSDKNEDIKIISDTVTPL